MGLFIKFPSIRILTKGINSIYYFFQRNPLVIKAWIKVRWGRVIPNNWGDDINYYLLGMISKRSVIIATQSLYHLLRKPKNYICIGSILGWYEDKRSEIWGAGFIEDGQIIKVKPAAIHLVRGKLSREILLAQGIQCPEIYGDPALLLSKYYIPHIEKKYKMGIVPHFVDYDNPILNKFLETHSDCIKIRLKGYEKWTDVIDQILSCDFIISSSLHGLIVSDSYCIPNLWVSFSDGIRGGSFKYLDYFSSVERNEKNPVKIKHTTDLEYFYKAPPNKCMCKIDFDTILRSCPFIAKQ